MVEGTAMMAQHHQAAEQALPLTALEALHVRAVLAVALEKLALVGVADDDPAAQAQALTQSVGDGIGRMISEQRRLEARFEELAAAQRELRGQPNRLKAQENEAELAHVTEALRAATQQLCHNLKDNLNIGDNMAKVSRERASLVALLTAAVRSLHEPPPMDGAGLFGGGGGGGLTDGDGSGGPYCAGPSLAPVLEAVLASEQAEAEAREVVEAERAASTAVRQLRQDLRDERAAHEQAMRERRLALATTKEQLRGDELRLAVEGRYQSKGLEASNQCARRAQRAELAAAAERLALLRRQAGVERAVAAAASDFLGRSAAARQDDAVGWASRREEDARARERQVELVRAQHQRDTVRLRNLSSKLDEERELKARRDEQKREEAEAAEREAADAVRRLRAAVRIQAAWRGHKARQLAQSGGKRTKTATKGKKASAKK